MTLQALSKLSVVFSLVLYANGIAQAQSLFLLSEETTEPQSVSLNVKSVEDTANHRCCVSPLPIQVNLFLDKGSLVIAPSIGLSFPSYLEVGPMSVDSNLEFRGESRTTVAGFPNISTVLSGSISSDESISAEIKIGANGGLPQGLPLTYDVEFKPEFKLAFVTPSPSQVHLSLDSSAMKLGDILIEDRELPPASGLDLFVSISVGSESDDADWWIAMQDNAADDADLQERLFHLANGTWQPGLLPSHQGPLINIPEPFMLLKGFVPTSNDFVIVFGVDRDRNGLFDVGSSTTFGYRFR
ncbi:MAG: hypothetical protein AB8B95_11240 [Pseudohongiellaceae bacterium]